MQTSLKDKWRIPPMVEYGKSMKSQTKTTCRQAGWMDITQHPTIIHLEDFACMGIGQCNNGRVGISLSEEAWITINGASNAKDRVSCQMLKDSRRILSKMLFMQESQTGRMLLRGWLTLWICPASAYISWCRPQSLVWLEALAVLMGVSLNWELTQWEIPDHCPLWWFALYGYLQYLFAPPFSR